mgnify:CR=1 FL=1
MHSGSRFKEIRGTVRFFVNSSQLVRICLFSCLSHTYISPLGMVYPRKILISSLGKKFLSLVHFSRNKSFNNLESQQKKKKKEKEKQWFKVVENLETRRSGRVESSLGSSKRGGSNVTRGLIRGKRKCASKRQCKFPTIAKALSAAAVKLLERVLQREWRAAVEKRP